MDSRNLETGKVGESGQGVNIVRSTNLGLSRRDDVTRSYWIEHDGAFRMILVNKSVRGLNLIGFGLGRKSLDEIKRTNKSKRINIIFVEGVGDLVDLPDGMGHIKLEHDFWRFGHRNNGKCVYNTKSEGIAFHTATKYRKDEVQNINFLKKAKAYGVTISSESESDVSQRDEVRNLRIRKSERMSELEIEVNLQDGDNDSSELESPSWSDSVNVETLRQLNTQMEEQSNYEIREENLEERMDSITSVDTVISQEREEEAQETRMQDEFKNKGILIEEKSKPKIEREKRERVKVPNVTIETNPIEAIELEDKRVTLNKTGITPGEIKTMIEILKMDLRNSGDMSIYKADGLFRIDGIYSGGLITSLKQEVKAPIILQMQNRCFMFAIEDNS